MEAKLLDTPETNYALEIGRNNTKNLGYLQTNSLVVFTNYEIIPTSDENSKVELTVQSTFS